MCVFTRWGGQEVDDDIDLTFVCSYMRVIHCPHTVIIVTNQSKSFVRKRKQKDNPYVFYIFNNIPLDRR